MTTLALEADRNMLSQMRKYEKANEIKSHLFSLVARLRQHTISACCRCYRFVTSVQQATKQNVQVQVFIAKTN